MKKKIINQREAIKKLKCFEDINLYQIEINEEKIEALDAILLGKNNIDFPEELIFYDDEDIDYSDIPEITEEEFIPEKIKFLMDAKILLSKEIKLWIDNENIDVNKLASELIHDFYKKIKKD